MLEDEQFEAAGTLLRSALNPEPGVGYNQAAQVVLANGLLGQRMIEDYYLEILGEPSETGAWLLRFSGHHLAINLTYDDGVLVGLSPFFIGVEPLSWTSGGKTLTPLGEMTDGVVAALSSLGPDQLAQAKLERGFPDVVVGAAVEGFFPNANSGGINVGELTEDQQRLVLAALDPWISVGSESAAEAFRARYESELAGT